MGSFTTTITPEGPNSNLGITASKWGALREISHDAEMVPKAGVSAPTSSTMLPVRNKICFPINAVETWDLKEIKRHIQCFSNFSVCGSHWELLKCRFWFCRSGLGPETWGLNCLSRVHSLNRKKNYVVSLSAHQEANACGPTQNHLIWFFWGGVQRLIFLQNSPGDFTVQPGLKTTEPQLFCVLWNLLISKHASS